MTEIVELTDEELFEEIQQRLGTCKTFRDLVDAVAETQPETPYLDIERGIRRALERTRAQREAILRELAEPPPPKLN